MDDSTKWITELLQRIRAAASTTVTKVKDVKPEDKGNYETLVHQYMKSESLLRVLSAFEPTMMDEFVKEIRSYKRDEFRRKLTGVTLHMLPFPYQSTFKQEQSQEVVEWMEANPRFLTMNLDNLAQSMCLYFMLETHIEPSYDLSKTLKQNVQDILDTERLSDAFLE
jgi:hypothetical protein